MPRLAKAKKQVSWKTPTDRTIGQSARCGQARRPSAASSAKAVRRGQGGARRRQPHRRAGRQADLDDRPGEAEQHDRRGELQPGEPRVGTFVVHGSFVAKANGPSICAGSLLRYARFSSGDRKRLAAGAAASPSARPARSCSTLAVPVVEQAARRAATWSRRRAPRPAPCSTPSQCGWSMRCQTTVSGLTLSSKRAVRVVDEGHAAGHAGREVGADVAQDHGGAAGHVFAAVRAARPRPPCRRRSCAPRSARRRGRRRTACRPSRRRGRCCR